MSSLTSAMHDRVGVVDRPSDGGEPSSSDDEDVRPLGRCPLCGNASTPLDHLTFAAKPPLARDVAFEYCAGCDFIHAGALSASAYRGYYETVRNDGDHVVLSDDDDSYDRLQGSHIAAAVATDFAGSVLDVGCGQGRLLHFLEKRFPDAALIGYDVANYLPPASTVRFVDRIDDLDRRFDVVILSHVIEHLVGFDLLRRVADLLAPGGRVYIEVPNPFQYEACPRREFMYYVDRLHVNHFGPRAIAMLLARFGLRIVERGTHRFRYRDGHYPAAWFLAARTSAGAPIDDQAPCGLPLDRVYARYRASEAVRARAWRDRLPAACARDGIVVYGAGDNFHRALWNDGPLHGLPILAVMDRRAADLRQDPRFQYALPEAALARHREAPIVVTVSQGSEEVAAELHALAPGRTVLFA